MEDNGNRYVFVQNDEEDEDQMYVIEDENNINGENFQNFAFADGCNDNMLQLQDGEVLNGDQLIYDEYGQAYIIDQNNTEPNDNNLTYNCPLCTQSYQNANAFTKHMREKHFVKVFTCRQCEQFFDNLSLLFLHARRTHVDPKKPQKNPTSFKFHCTHCPYMTNNGGTMEHHQRAHNGIKPYKCDICDKSFAQKANMKTHRNRHIHKDRIFRCDVCNKSFNSHDIYLAHLRTREHELQEHYHVSQRPKIQIQCLGCNEEFSSYFEVNKHSRSCDYPHGLVDKFWCVQCKEGFSTSMSLKHHLKSHGGNMVISCPVCSERGFPGFNQLNHHITRAHALKVNRRNVCRYCEMTFETKEMLLDHIEEMHIAEKNARQSRGAAGRLRCRYEHCDFTSNSVMQMDRHHDQHVSNTLPSTTKRPPVRRPRKPVFVGEKEEPLELAEIEHFNATMSANEILRVSRDYGHNDNFNLEDDDASIKLEMMVNNDYGDEDYLSSFTRTNEDCIDDMDVDDLEKLAASYVEKPLKSDPEDGKRKRGRPRKNPLKSPKKSNNKKTIDFKLHIKNEQFDISESFDQSLLDHNINMYATNQNAGHN